MKKPASSHGFKRILNASLYSYKGLVAALKTSPAFREEFILAILLTPFAVWLPVSLQEKLWLIAAVFIVLIVELLNSAIETTVDRIGAEFHLLSGRAKDMGSAAVLLSLIFAGVVWGVVLLNYIF